MFGTKLKTWMENHIGRPKKKDKEKICQNGRGGIFLESSESLACSDTGISSGSQQVLSSSVTDNKEGGYCTTTLESDKSGMTHCLTAVSLPSPESAYSTGYSTDGASPGGTGPPEYYINIRTGKHYFPSPAPTPTSPQPNLTFASSFHSGNQYFPESFPVNETSSLPPVVPVLPAPRVPSACLQKTGSFASSARVRSVPPGAKLSNGSPAALNGAFGPEPSAKVSLTEGPEVKANSSHFEIFNFSKSPCKKSPPKSQLSTLKLFLKSPKQDKGKDKEEINKALSLENKKKLFSPTKNKKWYKQPFQKFGQKRAFPVYDVINPKAEEPKKDVAFDKSLYYLTAATKENTSSPRQRNRIKTNPWLPTEPMSSQNFHGLQVNFSPSLTRNRSCTNTPLQNRKTIANLDVLRLKEMSARYEESSKEYPINLENSVDRHEIGKQIHLDASDHSEEDLTLNEMMGTYNESYVYEKETDILSDSDPTDCEEDYVSDSEADNGGDEQDSHDDELDYIDNGSVAETDTDKFPGNTGKCTYHDVCLRKNSFLHKGDRQSSKRENDGRKSFRKDREGKGRRSKEDKRRRSARKYFKCDENGEWAKKSEGKAKFKFELDENIGGLNLSRVLMQRMLARSGGSKSADGTPVSIRRQNLIKELGGTHAEVDRTKPDTVKRKNSFNSDALLVDVEGDRKYKELIEEAENMLASMQNSPLVQNRRKMFLQTLESRKDDAGAMGPRKKEEPERSLKNFEVMAARKSPKHLGLKLRREFGDEAAGDPSPKTFKPFEFGKEKKNGLRAKSSAHSPLDPLGPTFRNFSVFKPVNVDDEKTSRSSSEEFEPRKLRQRPPRESEAGWSDLAESQFVPIAFQSVDLGKPSMSYCPQSEPVKRKIYTCSKTYDKLVKRFENTPMIFEETSNGPAQVQEKNHIIRPEGIWSKEQKSAEGLAGPKNHLVPDLCNPKGVVREVRRASPRRGSTPSPNFSHRHLICAETFR